MRLIGENTEAVGKMVVLEEIFGVTYPIKINPKPGCLIICLFATAFPTDKMVEMLF